MQEGSGMSNIATPYTYIFLDESGNFDFRKSGTRYLILTSVSMRRPFPLCRHLDRYKHDCIEKGTNIEFFHCYNDRKSTRHAVFNRIAEHLDNICIHCVVVEKARIAPATQTTSRIYRWMLGYLLRWALTAELDTGVDKVIVITDTIPVNKKTKSC